MLHFWYVLRIFSSCSTKERLYWNKEIQSVSSILSDAASDMVFGFWPSQTKVPGTTVVPFTVAVEVFCLLFLQWSNCRKWRSEKDRMDIAGLIVVLVLVRQKKNSGRWWTRTAVAPFLSFAFPLRILALEGLVETFATQYYNKLFATIRIKSLRTFHFR